MTGRTFTIEISRENGMIWGEVVELPIDAAAILTTAERELAIAQQRLELRNAEVESTTADLGKIHVDEALLGLAPDINKLDNLRLQYSAYGRDIDRQKNEMAAHWQAVCDSCNQLGWIPESEASITKRLPTLLIQRELRQLVRDHGGMTQILRAAEQAERTKLTEIDSLSKQLAGLQSGEVKPALRAALTKARSFGDSEMTIQKQQAALTKSKSMLEGLLRELGQWSKALPYLLSIQPPSQENISRLVQHRQALISDQKAELIRMKNQKTEVARIELDIAQFKEIHHPTTHDTVILARNERDISWQAIKTGKSSMQQGAENFEVTIIHADNVADKRLDDVAHRSIENLGTTIDVISLPLQLFRNDSNLVWIDFGIWWMSKFTPKTAVLDFLFELVDLSFKNTS